MVARSRERALVTLDDVESVEAHTWRCSQEDNADGGNHSCFVSFWIARLTC